MVLQESLQNLQLDPLPQSRPLTAHSPDEAASESWSGDYNCRENLPGKLLGDPTRACSAPGKEHSVEPREMLLGAAQGCGCGVAGNQIMPRTSPGARRKESLNAFQLRIWGRALSPEQASGHRISMGIPSQRGHCSQINIPTEKPAWLAKFSKTPPSATPLCLQLLTQQEANHGEVDDMENRMEPTPPQRNKRVLKIPMGCSQHWQSLANT